MNDSQPEQSSVSDAALTGSALLVNEVGLHARPSVKLTQFAKRFDASIEFALDADGPWADAKSPVKVMRVKAPKGATLHFRVRGSDAASALAALLALVERGFDTEAMALPDDGTDDGKAL
jgi:phosphocarrier protein HPr